MEGFKPSAALKGMLESYPDAQQIIKASTDGGRQSKIAIARLWLSEGIPYAFKDCPAIYETVRAWLGTRLNVDPKEINITGSGRIGQSLAPHKSGTAFGDHSDLDLFIVSKDLYDRMVADFNLWSFQYESGAVSPSNENEKRFWKDNNRNTPKNIQRGFIDSNIVPNRNEYTTIQGIANSMWLLKEKLDITDDAPKVKSASIRCYKSWNEYVNQMVISLP